MVWAIEGRKGECIGASMRLGSSHMSTPARVLLIGRELAHLEARVAVLEHFWRVGMAVVETETRVELKADVVVVCETLPELERQAWVSRARQEVPGAVVVKMNRHDAGPQAGADATVDEIHGPGALVSTIYELLTERGLESRAWPIAGESVRLG